MSHRNIAPSQFARRLHRNHRRRGRLRYKWSSPQKRYGRLPLPQSRSRGSFNPGLLGRIGRPSVARAAWSCGVTGRSVTTLLVRRRPPSEPEQPYRIALPVECPVAQLCGMYRGAGRSYRHNCVPGTSRWGALPAACDETKNQKPKTKNSNRRLRFRGASFRASPVCLRSSTPGGAGTPPGR